ncbi:MAG: helix-turn-helix domain-containing protein [Coriobacteriales bacterium]|jgi:DNA-binding XRE family transcriptional regulator
MRVFAIYDARKTKRRACAWLIYEPGRDEYLIEIRDDAGPDELPLALALASERGARYLPNRIARPWAESRLFDCGRADIDEVLERFGIAEFYLPTLLAATQGRSSDDDFLLEEVPQDDYRSAPIGERPGAPAQLGTALGRARRAAGMTQAELAAKTGIQQAQISRIEHGNGNPTLGTLETLARGVGRTLDITLE